MRYDDKFRAGALVMLEAAGYPENEHKLTEVAHHLNVPYQTLRRWYKGESNPVAHEIVQQEKKDLAQRLEDTAHKLLDSICGNLDNGNIQQQSVSLGILIEKMQLLRNEPTERVAHELSDVERSERIAAILERSRQERARQLTSGNTPIQ